jgi:hypothetical protein
MPPVLTLTQEELESDDVRSLENSPGYSGAALTCRVCRLRDLHEMCRYGIEGKTGVVIRGSRA